MQGDTQLFSFSPLPTLPTPLPPSGWCLATVMVWLWWTTSRRQYCLTWGQSSFMAPMTPTRDSLGRQERHDSPPEVIKKKGQKVFLCYQLLLSCFVDIITNCPVQVISVLLYCTYMNAFSVFQAYLHRFVKFKIGILDLSLHFLFKYSY